MRAKREIIQQNAFVCFEVEEVEDTSCSRNSTTIPHSAPSPDISRISFALSKARLVMPSKAILDSGLIGLAGA